MSGEEEVAGVDSHLFDSLPTDEVVASTALHVGMREIIEPSGVAVEELEVGYCCLLARLDCFHSAIRCAAVGDATPPYDVLEFVKHEITSSVSSLQYTTVARLISSRY